MFGLPEQTVTVLRANGGFTDRGTWQTQTWAPFEVSGSLQPVSGEYAQQFPEAVRESVRYTLYLAATEEVLHTAKDGTRPADRVIIQTPDGEDQEMVVLDREGWQLDMIGAHIRYTLGDI